MRVVIHAWNVLRVHYTLPETHNPTLIYIYVIFLSFLSTHAFGHSSVKCLTRSLHGLFTPLPVAWKSLYRKHVTLTYNTKESVRLLCENNRTCLRSTLFALVLNNWMSPLAQFIKTIAKYLIRYITSRRLDFRGIATFNVPIFAYFWRARRQVYCFKARLI